MTITVSPQLKAHMQKQRRRHIVVEVVSAETSDFDVTELHIFTADARRAAFFTEKKRYRAVEADGLTVLLPPYRLSCAEDVSFDLKSLLFIHTVTCKGIAL